MSGPAPRLRDVAERAGVSMTTASIVLRWEPGARVSPSTRSRVHSAAEDLGYAPRARRPALRLIGLAGDPRQPVLSGKFQSALVAEALRHNAFLVPLPEREDAVAVVETAFNPAGHHLAATIRVGGWPTPAGTALHGGSKDVYVDVAPRGDLMSPFGSGAVVVPDEGLAAFRVGDALARQGYRTATVITAAAEQGLATAWADGLSDRLGEHAVTFVDVAEFTARTMRPAGARGLWAGEMPAALVCTSEDVLRGVREWIGPFGRDAGPGVVVVRGEPSAAPRGGVPVTWVSLPIEGLARAAVAEALAETATAEPRVTPVPYALGEDLDVTPVWLATAQ